MVVALYLVALWPSVYVRLGDIEYLIDFHVIENLVTTALVGSRNLRRVGAQMFHGGGSN